MPHALAGLGGARWFVQRFLLTLALMTATTWLSPNVHADINVGNYDLNIQGRYDFHTWVWNLTGCPGSCVHVLGIARPVARAFNYQGDAHLADGRYTLAVDVPDGLRCDNVYYGPMIPTHDVYSWDAVTFAGSLRSSFDAGCDGAPGGTLDYPFTLTRL